MALATERIRVGSGGIMLPHFSPFKIAETFRLLGAMAPGRIDLGLGRAPGSDQRTAYALQRDRTRRKDAVHIAHLRQRYRALTERERDVMALVVLGHANKQIGSELGLAEVTVKTHRRQIMQKMGARSLPDLVRMADRLTGAVEVD